MTTIEILTKYTAGEATVEETNAALAEAGAGYHLEPGKNVLTEEEMRQTTIGHFPDQANGFGLLDTGTGTLDKVSIDHGVICTANPGDSHALLFVAGRMYGVDGPNVVTYVAPTPCTGLPEHPDLHIRKDLAGQTIVQELRSCLYQVTYDEDGKPHGQRLRPDDQ